MDKRAAQLENNYQKRFEGADLYRDSVWKILCQDFFSKFISPTSVILDVGAGWGEFSKNIQAQKKYAMDLNPECGKRIAGYASFLQQDCAAPWPFEDDTLDVVFTSNFLEHLPGKAAIDRTLDEAFRCLKGGGKIICLGPNIKFLPGSYWDFWDHHVPISDQSLAEALMLKKFLIQSKIDRFLPYTMSNGTQPPLVAVRIYLKCRFLWRYFGRQFIVIATKPDS